MFKKILIATRGEIAVRVIRACRELNIPTVAIYSQADCDSLHVRQADEAICVGPPPGSDSYLNISNILSAALLTESEAVHPGIGFLAENTTFAEACGAVGLKFIGPTPQAIELMGDKSRARAVVKAAGLPIIPGTDDAVQSETEAVKIAREIGYPVAIKASAGGGGKGIRFVENDDELLANFSLAQNEARAAFGNPDVYMEKKILNPRHIEIQVMGDEHGEILHLGERDCSIQSRNQKLIEEGPSPALTPELREQIAQTALSCARAGNYTNAGTVEFLLEPSGNFYFMEMNTRIQIEHPVTEWITGLDLVKLQIRIAAGEPLPLRQEEVRIEGHAIECRINAADPDRNFAPSVGRVDELILPGGPGVRVDTHLYPGYEVPIYYDSLLAKIITYGNDRDEALERMDRSLREFKAGDLKTTAPFHRKILQNSVFRMGEADLNFLPTHFGVK
ncbi:MAG: acetyl-CoA carboxylase biotin carboxylase subunit [Armatimonadetes bacterium]|nr:acetyl-CoA carboxylase biotin carboxylase subunit [Armatimonadota bacterium]